MQKKFVSIAIAVGLGFAFFSWLGDRQVAGILPIGGDAVYIEGEACTVNMTLARSSTSIQNDFRACMGFHALYVQRACSSTVSTTSVARPADCKARTSTAQGENWNIPVGGGWTLTTSTAR